MIAHIVTITWTDDSHPDAEALAASLRAAAAGIPQIVLYRAGEALGLRPGADFGVIAVAADAAGLAAYLDSAVHTEIVERDMKPYIATRQAVQIDVGDLR